MTVNLLPGRSTVWIFSPDEHTLYEMYVTTEACEHASRDYSMHGRSRHACELSTRG